MRARACTPRRNPDARPYPDPNPNPDPDPDPDVSSFTVRKSPAMISPADALTMTLESQASLLENSSQAEFDLPSWIMKHVHPDFTVPFVALGADEVSDLELFEDHDPTEIGMPPIKRRKLLKEINKPNGGKRVLPPHDEARVFHFFPSHSFAPSPIGFILYLSQAFAFMCIDLFAYRAASG